MGIEKYYTPDIEEFHVGFECELRNSSGKDFEWEPFKIVGVDDGEISGHLMDWSFYDSANAIKDGMIRVKYLDREDVEECGWELVSEGDTFVFKRNEPRNPDEAEEFLEYWHLNLQNGTVCIHNNRFYDSEVIIFYGAIKNKSELKFIQKCLGITK